jgi:type I restriction enzyme S subunit
VAKIENLAKKIEQAHGLRQQAIQETDVVIDTALREMRTRALTENTTGIWSCCNMSTGTTPPTHRLDYFGGPINWYTPADLSFQRRVGPSYRTITETAVLEGKARIFDADTILLVAIGASLGKVALTHERCSSNQQITGIRFHPEVLPEYGFWWIRSLYNELRYAAPQATLPIINQNRIGEFPIAILPKPEQRRIVKCLDDLQVKVDGLKALQAQTAAELDALLPSILDKAFKGEL